MTSPRTDHFKSGLAVRLRQGIIDVPRFFQATGDLLAALFKPTYLYIVGTAYQEVDKIDFQDLNFNHERLFINKVISKSYYTFSFLGDPAPDIIDQSLLSVGATTAYIFALPTYVLGLVSKSMAELFVVFYSPFAIQELEQIAKELKECVAHAGQALPVVETNFVTSRSLKLLSGKGVHKISADNYLGYRLIDELAKISTAWESAGVWRLSRSEMTIDCLAERPRQGTFGRAINQNVNILESLLVITSQHFIRLKLPPIILVYLSECSQPYWRCNFLSHIARYIGEKRAVEVGLSCVESRVEMPSQGEKRLFICVPGTVHKELEKSFEDVGVEIFNNMQPGITEELLLLIAWTGDFGPQWQAQEKGRIDFGSEVENIRKKCRDLQSPEGFLERRNLPFLSLFGIKGAIAKHSPSEVAIAKRIFESVLKGVEIFSQQRLSLSIFTHCYGMLDTTNGKMGIWQALEFASKTLFDAHFLIVWNIRKAYSEPVYCSFPLKGELLPMTELMLGKIEFVPEFKRYFHARGTEDLTLDTLLRAIRSEQPASEPALTDSLSAFQFKVQGIAETYVIMCLRSQATKASAQDKAFWKAIAATVERRLTFLDSARTGDENDKDFEFRRLIETQGNHQVESFFKNIVSGLSAVLQEKASSVVVFQYDNDSNALIYSEGINPAKSSSSETIILGSHGDSFAAQVVKHNKILIGTLEEEDFIVRLTMEEDASQLPITRVPFLSWIPKPGKVIGLPIHLPSQFNEGQNTIFAVVVIGLSFDLDVEQIDSLVHQVIRMSAWIEFYVERAIHGNASRIRACMRPGKVELKRLSSLQQMPPVAPRFVMPPEIDTFLNSKAREAFDTLLTQVSQILPVHSITLRIANWFGRYLYRVGSAGAKSQWDYLDVMKTPGIATYLYRHAKSYKCISLPSTNEIALCDLARIAYPNLTYLPSREKTRSQLCMLICDSAKTPLGTLNFEASKQGALGVIKPLLNTVREEVEEILQQFNEVQSARSANTLFIANTFMAHSLHEIKNVLNPIASKCKTILRDGSIDPEIAGKIDVQIRTVTKRLVDDMNSAIESNNSGPVNLSQIIDAIAELYRQYHSIVEGDSEGSIFVLKPQEPCWAMASRPHVTNALKGLLINTGEFARTGLPLRARKPVILGLEKSEDDVISIFIAHAGRRMEPSAARGLFWYRIENTISSGVGLALAGIQLRLLGAYPRAFYDAATDLRAQKDYPDYHTWFRISWKTRTIPKGFS